MIELITGLPGNGKTLYAIATVKELAERENRPVFYHGIPELKLGWELIEDPREWAKVPPGAIVVIDEAQKTFRNRSLGSVPPSFVTELETHRHMGVDLFLITQHPSLIDPAVRRLAGRHRHMVRIWGMESSTVHRWDSVKDNCDKSRADSEKTKWAFDKSVYKYYKSAEQHTMRRSIPARVKLLVAVPVVLIALGWYAVHVLKKPVPVGAVVPVGGVAGGAAVGVAAKVPFDKVADAREYLAMLTPRIEGLPQTAPKYDELTKPVRVPVPAACIERAGAVDITCKCFSQQGTPMDVNFGMCRQFARNGFFQDFDPERDRQQTERAGRSVAVLDRGGDAVAARSGRDSLSSGQVAMFPADSPTYRIAGTSLSK